MYLLWLAAGKSAITLFVWWNIECVSHTLSCSKCTLSCISHYRGSETWRPNSWLRCAQMLQHSHDPLVRTSPRFPQFRYCGDLTLHLSVTPSPFLGEWFPLRTAWSCQSPNKVCQQLVQCLYQGPWALSSSSVRRTLLILSRHKLYKQRQTKASIKACYKIDATDEAHHGQGLNSLINSMKQASVKRISAWIVAFSMH